MLSEFTEASFLQKRMTWCNSKADSIVWIEEGDADLRGLCGFMPRKRFLFSGFFIWHDIRL